MGIRTSVYIAASLDGFIARRNGAIDWLTAAEYTQEGEDYGYAAFMETVDVIVMGRNSFETVAAFDPWPYPKKVVVLSSRPLVPPAALADKVEVLNMEPAPLLAHLAEQGVGHVYVDGGLTLQRFIAAGLLNTLIVTHIPILLGEGIPLFGPIPGDVKLTHVETRSFASGLVQSQYRLG